MNERHDTVILLDVDNTLLDNDAVERDLRLHLQDAFGAECQERYWQIFERLRADLGYADYLGALQRYRIDTPAIRGSWKSLCSWSTIRSRADCIRWRVK